MSATDLFSAVVAVGITTMFIYLVLKSIPKETK